MGNDARTGADPTSADNPNGLFQQKAGSGVAYPAKMSTVTPIRPGAEISLEARIAALLCFRQKLARQPECKIHFLRLILSPKVIYFCFAVDTGRQADGWF